MDVPAYKGLPLQCVGVGVNSALQCVGVGFNSACRLYMPRDLLIAEEAKPRRGLLLQSQFDVRVASRRLSAPDELEIGRSTGRPLVLGEHTAFVCEFENPKGGTAVRNLPAAAWGEA